MAIMWSILEKALWDNKKNLYFTAGDQYSVDSFSSIWSIM